MSTTYPYYSNKFPNQIDNFDRFEDPSADYMPLVKLYYDNIEKGTEEGLTAAQAILTNNPELKKMIVNADRLNLLRDSLLSIEEYYMSDVQQYLIELVQYKGAYSSSTTYRKFNIVKYNGLSYMYINNTSGKNHAPTNTSYWIALTLQGEKGNDGVDLAFKGSYNNSTSYPANSAVEYHGSLYGSLQATQGHAPTIGGSNAYWSLVLDSDTLIVDYNSNSANQIQEAYNQGKTVIVKYNITDGSEYNTDVVYGYLTNVQYTDTNRYYRFVGWYRQSGEAYTTGGTLKYYYFYLDYNISSSTSTWGKSTNPLNNIYFVTYGTTTTGMIDAYNQGKLVVMRQTSTSPNTNTIYLPLYQMVEWSSREKFYIFAGTSGTSTCRCQATYDSTLNTISWSSITITTIQQNYEAVYGDTSQSLWSNLETAYQNHLVIYCYYNDCIYYLSHKQIINSERTIYVFINTNDINTTYRIRCIHDTSSGITNWLPT